jgi:hypothetical protein
VSHVAQMQLRNHNRGRRRYKTGESVRGPALRAARPFLGATARNRGPNSITAMREANRDSGEESGGRTVGTGDSGGRDSGDRAYGTGQWGQWGRDSGDRAKAPGRTVGTEHINNDDHPSGTTIRRGQSTS